MKLGDIYINKENKSLIQIDSFASHMGDFLKGHVIIFRQLEEHGDLNINVRMKELNLLKQMKVIQVVHLFLMEKIQLRKITIKIEESIEGYFRVRKENILMQM